MRSTVTLGDISDGVDFLIGFYHLKRAYVKLDNNFANYRYMAEITLQDKVGEVTANMQKEVDHWKLAWEQDNKWYNKFWFGATVATAIMVLTMFLSK